MMQTTPGSKKESARWYEGSRRIREKVVAKDAKRKTQSAFWKPAKQRAGKSAYREFVPLPLNV